jgi:hypothetical protein
LRVTAVSDERTTVQLASILESEGLTWQVLFTIGNKCGARNKATHRDCGIQSRGRP